MSDGTVTRPVLCGLCHAELGQEVTTAAGKSHLVVGAVKVRAIESVCEACGHPFSWWTSAGWRALNDKRRTIDSP